MIDIIFIILASIAAAWSLFNYLITLKQCLISAGGIKFNPWVAPVSIICELAIWIAGLFTIAWPYFFLQLANIILFKSSISGLPQTFEGSINQSKLALLFGATELIIYSLILYKLYL